jgi:hypothetical protein
MEVTPAQLASRKPVPNAGLRSRINTDMEAVARHGNPNNTIAWSDRGDCYRIFLVRKLSGPPLAAPTSSRSSLVKEFHTLTRGRSALPGSSTTRPVMATIPPNPLNLGSECVRDRSTLQ